MENPRTQTRFSSTGYRFFTLSSASNRAIPQRPRPIHSLLHERLSNRNLTGVEELVIGQCVAGGVVIDLHVRQQIERSLALQGGPQRLDLAAQLIDPRLNLRPVDRGNL